MLLAVWFQTSLYWFKQISGRVRAQPTPCADTMKRPRGAPARTKARRTRDTLVFTALLRPVDGRRQTAASSSSLANTRNGSAAITANNR